MSKVSTTATANAKPQSTAEALIKPGKQLAQPDRESFFKNSTDFSSLQTGFDLTQIPVHPLLHTSQQIQCCAKDGAGCSCPKCKAAAATNESKSADEQPEVDHSRSEETAIEQTAIEQNPEKISELQHKESETESEQQTIGGLLVEDSVTDLSEGQMKKTEFLQKLRENICNTIGPILATVGQTTDGCPYLNYWLDLYQEKDATHIEKTAKKYAPDVANANTAEDYISIITQRALHAAEIWATTGKLSGVPEGAPTTLPNESPKENTGEENPIQAKAKNGGLKNANDPKNIKDQLGNGQQLSPGVRSRMESAFGMNFSHVRTHTDSVASNISNEVNARAFTVGNHIAFSNGEYQPGTLLGDALIAHELAHTIQQRDTEKSLNKMEAESNQYDALEGEADKVSISVISSLWGGTANVSKRLAKRTMPILRSGLKLQRCGKKEENKASTPSKTPTKCPVTYTIPDDVHTALDEAWIKSGHGGDTVTEHGGRIVTDKDGKRVIRTGSGGGGSISLPAERVGDTTTGTFHTHPYSKSEGAEKIGVSFSGGDIENFIAGGQGTVKYIGAGSCDFVLNTIDSTARDSCKKEDIPKRWNDEFAKSGGTFQQKVGNAVKASIVNCGLCYYEACRPDEKSPIPKNANLVQ